MATRAEAEAVLDKKAETLRKAGAHALQVDSGQRHGVRGSVIVAWVPKDFRGSVPESVSATVSGKKVTVAVKAKPSEPFKAESL
jgi:hypothetical protein